MEEEESSEETLPTVYGIMIAFLTCVVGYVLWVSVALINCTKSITASLKRFNREIVFNRNCDSAFSSVHLLTAKQSLKISKSIVWNSLN